PPSHRRRGASPAATSPATPRRGEPVRAASRDPPESPPRGITCLYDPQSQAGAAVHLLTAAYRSHHFRTSFAFRSAPSFIQRCRRVTSATRRAAQCDSVAFHTASEKIPYILRISFLRSG